MSNVLEQWDAGGKAVAERAFLYVNGELGPAEAAAFEARLGQDQSAREALVEAMQVVKPLPPHGPARPNPAYRQQVRQRLHQRRPWGWLFGRRPYRGHPAVWSALGAIAALLMVIAVIEVKTALVTQAYPALPAPSALEEEHLVWPAQLAATPDLAKTMGHPLVDGVVPELGEVAHPDP